MPGLRPLLLFCGALTTSRPTESPLHRYTTATSSLAVMTRTAVPSALCIACVVGFHMVSVAAVHGRSRASNGACQKIQSFQFFSTHLRQTRNFNVHLVMIGLLYKVYHSGCWRKFTYLPRLRPYPVGGGVGFCAKFQCFCAHCDMVCE